MSGADDTTAATLPTQSSPLRWLYFALAWVFVGLGAIGVVLPILPTTPFMLLALGCFARSSPRFHRWLYNHKYFGPSLQRWREHRVIPRRVKVFAISTMAVSLGAMIAASGAPWYAIGLTAALMAYGAFFILRCPSVVAPTDEPTAPKPEPEPTSTARDASPPAG